jgi:hypothetical protein
MFCDGHCRISDLRWVSERTIKHSIVVQYCRACQYFRNFKQYGSLTVCDQVVGDLAQTHAVDRQQSLRASRSATGVMRSLLTTCDSLLECTRSSANCMDALLRKRLWVDTSIQHSFHFDWCILDYENSKLVLLIKEASFNPNPFKLVLRYFCLYRRLCQIPFCCVHMLFRKRFNCHGCE